MFRLLPDFNQRSAVPTCPPSNSITYQRMDPSAGRSHTTLVLNHATKKQPLGGDGGIRLEDYSTLVRRREVTRLSDHDYQASMFMHSTWVQCFQRKSCSHPAPTALRP